MSTVDDGSHEPTFWSFVLGHDNLSPVEQQRHWLEHTVCLELIRHKDGSIVSISKISEVIISKCSSLMLWNLQLYNNIFERKTVTFTGVKTYFDSPIYFQGSQPDNPKIYDPAWRKSEIAWQMVTWQCVLRLQTKDCICKNFENYTHAVDDQLLEGHLWSMSIVDGGSPAPTFWSFVFGHDNLNLVHQQRHWLEDTVCLELIRHKDGSIVSISKIIEVIMSIFC